MNDHRIWVADSGCIGCRICEKNCPCGAITVTNKQAGIDYEKCIECGMCATKCPKGVIHDVIGLFAAAE